MSAVQKEAEKEQARTELEDVLAYHGGDALEAVKSLLNDCRNLRGQLAISEQITSVGYVRGWKPKYE
jgi:DNA repair exonuclease SbcCD ATPase subunit